MRAFLGIGCFAFAFLASVASWAASVQLGQGELLINQGQGFQKVNGTVEAQPGDSVMVTPNGTATVSYADGCHVPVNPGAVVTIAPISPCASGSMAQDGGFSNYGGLLMLLATGVGFGAAAYGYTQAKSTAPSLPASP